MLRGAVAGFAAAWLAGCPVRSPGGVVDTGAQDGDASGASDGAALDAAGPDAAGLDAPDVTGSPDVIDAPDEGGACAPPRQTCGAACTDTRTDPAHCGACGARCGEGSRCADGRCAPPATCDAAAAQGAPIGCEFWPTVLANSQAPRGEFGVALVSPPDAAGPTEVTISGGALGAPRVVTLMPGEARVETLPWVEALRQQIADPANPRPAVSALVRLGAYRVRATRPIAAYQFNPLQYRVGAEFTYSNDAAALRPAHGLGARYTAVARSSWGTTLGGSGSIVLGGQIAVVGTSATTTTVTVRLAAAIRGGSGVAAAEAGTTVTRTLAAGDVLLLVTGGPAVSSAMCTADDLTGSTITADGPVAVFGGHDCTNVPCERAACDHLEEQLAPDAAWSTRYVVAAPRDRTAADPSLVRVVSAADGNAVTFDGPGAPPAGRCPATLAAGAMCEFEARGDVAIEGTAPLAVAQFTQGLGPLSPMCAPSGGVPPTDPSCQGDPSMIVPVPTARWQARYSVFVPEGWTRTTLLLVHPAASPPRVDGTAVAPGGAAIGASGYVASVVVATPGAHVVDASAPFGLTVSGVAAYASYGYAALGSMR